MQDKSSAFFMLTNFLMTKFLSLIVLFLFAAHSFAQQDSTKMPVIVFKTETINYGTIQPKDGGVRYFEFTNTGKSPLIISAAKSSCGCTVPDYPKEPILPGQSGKIQVRYNTSKYGAFNRSITILSNATEPSKVLKITGTVEPEPKPTAP